MSRQIGISPKVIASMLTGLIVYLLTKLAISVDPAIEQAINVMAMVIAGYLAPPGDVEPAEIGPASDELLSDKARVKLEREVGAFHADGLIWVLAMVGVVLLILLLIGEINA